MLENSHVRCIGGRREIIINDLFQPITLRSIWYAVEISFSQNTYQSRSASILIHLGEVSQDKHRNDATSTF